MNATATFLGGVLVGVCIQEWRFFRLRLSVVSAMLAPLRARLREMLQAHYADTSRGVTARQADELEPLISSALEEIEVSLRPWFAAGLLRAVRDAHQRYSDQRNQDDFTQALRAMEALRAAVANVGGATWFDALRARKNRIAHALSAA